MLFINGRKTSSFGLEGELLKATCVNIQGEEGDGKERRENEVSLGEKCGFGAGRQAGAGQKRRARAAQCLRVSSESWPGPRPGWKGRGGGGGFKRPRRPARLSQESRCRFSKAKEEKVTGGWAGGGS